MIGTVRNMFAAIDACDWDRLPAFFAGACVYERPGYGPIEGLDRLADFYRHERRIAAGAHSLTGHFESRDGLVVVGDFAGQLRDGGDVNARFADYYLFAEGLIAHRRTYFYAALI